MSSTLSAFQWRGKPSEIGKTLMRTQTAPKSPPPPISFSKKPSHPLRNAEAQKIGSKSRAATASINTQPAKAARVTKAGI